MYETFKDRLKKLMEVAGYNNTTLAIALGIHRKTVERWLFNRYDPNYIMLIKLVQHFHVTIDYLLGQATYIKIMRPCEISIEAVKAHFREVLESFLTTNNLSENAFGKMLGLKHYNVSKWIKGECMPESKTLIRLSRVMGISIDSLLGI